MAGVSAVRGPSRKRSGREVSDHGDRRRIGPLGPVVARLFAGDIEAQENGGVTSSGSLAACRVATLGPEAYQFWFHQ
jgi:hypothetical protein